MSSGERSLKQIQKGWKSFKLKDIATITRGGSPRPIGDFITDSQDGLNWLKIGDIDNGAKYVTTTSQKIKPSGLSKTTLVKKGDFILSNSMSFGRPYILKLDTCIHDGWLAFKEIKKGIINTDFLYYLLLSDDLQRKFKMIAAGSGVKNLNRESVSNITVYLPPLSEQKFISDGLSVLDEVINKTREVISSSTKLKQALMQKFFSEDFPRKKISTVAEVLTGGTPSTSKKEYWDGGIPWMSSGEVNLRRIEKTEKSITELGLKNSNARILPIGTVMVALAGQGKTRGKVAILNTETTCNQSLAGIIPRKGTLMSEFLFFNLEHRYQELRDISGGEGRAGLNLKLINNFEIPVPPLEKQEEIANCLKAVDQKILINEKILEKQTHLKKGLMNRLLSEEFSD